MSSMTQSQPGEMIELMQRRIAEMSPEDRERMRRELTGEAGRDLITRESVYQVIRALRCTPASLASQAQYQRALSDVQRAVSHILTEREG